MMVHFDPNLAARCGIGAAVLYEDMLQVICRAKVMGDAVEQDGWIYARMPANSFGGSLPFLKPKQILACAKKLEFVKVIKATRINTGEMDSAYWYGVPKEVLPHRAKGGDING